MYLCTCSLGDRVFVTLLIGIAWCSFGGGGNSAGVEVVGGGN